MALDVKRSRKGVHSASLNGWRQVEEQAEQSGREIRRRKRLAIFTECTYAFLYVLRPVTFIELQTWTSFRLHLLSPRTFHIRAGFLPLHEFTLAIRGVSNVAIVNS